MTEKNFPKRIAIIMDGNRRYAKSKGLEPWKGHEEGQKIFEKLLDWCKEFGVQELTLYTFSMQNFKRSKQEIDFLMNLFKRNAEKILDDEKFNEEKNVKIKFVGRLNTDEIIDYYTNAQVFAFPTPGEDFGLVPAESMACGTPVVVWGDGAGPTEQVIDGVTGYHAKPYDLRDFAAKMDKVIDVNLNLGIKIRLFNLLKDSRQKKLKKDS